MFMCEPGKKQNSHKVFHLMVDYFGLHFHRYSTFALVMPRTLKMGSILVSPCVSVHSKNI